jgi:hypothetical protein
VEAELSNEPNTQATPEPEVEDSELLQEELADISGGGFGNTPGGGQQLPQIP